MKVLLFFLLFFTNFGFAHNWQLVWSDEFSEDGLPNSSKWSFDVDGNNWDWGNDEAQNYTPSSMHNAWVESGNLIIEARKEKYTWSGDNQEKDYTSARLVTANKGDWLYGRVEVRAKLPKGTGTWPAIWMLPTDWTYGAWPASGEIDIMEQVGYDFGVIHATVHTDSYNHTKGTQKSNSIVQNDVADSFHVYALEWTEDSISVFLDDIKYFTFQKEDWFSYKEWPFDKRFHLILNIAIGGSWGGVNGIDTTIFPVRMVVDYVRVYKDSSISGSQNDTTVASNEVVKNSTFDTYITPWVFNTTNGASGTVTIVDSAVNIDIDNLGANRWDVQLAQVGLSLTEGQTYKLSIKAKAEQAKKIYFGLAKNYDDYSPFITNELDLTTSYQTFKFTYTATADDNNSRVFVDVGTDLTSITVDDIYVTKISENIKEEIKVNSNSVKIYPNPFNPQTTIQYNSPINGGKITVYNVLGKKLKVYDEIKKGANNFIFNGKDMASGIYFVKISQSGNSFTKKMVLLK